MAPLTVVEALPGFGKTTLVATWTRRQQDRGAHAVWLRASEQLDDPMALDAHLQRALVRCGAVTPGPDRNPAVLTRDGAPVVVVVDDAHLLRDPDVVEALVRLVAVAHRVHVVVCCDTEHGFHEAAERHSVETNVLRGADLAVPVGQVPELAGAWGHDVDEATARSLHRLVGGWLLPLRLVLDATPPWAEELATHAAHDFLARRVRPVVGDAALLPTAARFAVPDVLDMALAGSLVPADDERDDRAALARRAVESLERQGVLWRVARNDGVPAWRYPVLVRHALQRLLERTDPRGLVEAHRAVARELADGNRRPVGLAQHARAAGEWSLLAKTWAEDGWSLAGGDAGAFQRAYAAIPGERLAAHPRLRVASVLADTVAETAPGTPWTHRVETLLRQYAELGAELPAAPDADGLALLELLTAAMVAERMQGRLDAAVELAGRAGDQLVRVRRSDPGVSRTSVVAWLRLQTSLTRYLAGDLGGALDHAVAAHHAGRRTLVGSGAAGLLAAMHSIDGQAAEARRWLAAHDEVDVADSWAAPLAQMPARLARAMLALDRLDAATAEAELAAAPIGPDASGLWPMTLLAHTRHALLFGDPAAMLARLHEVDRAMGQQLRSEEGAPRQVHDRCLADLTLALGEVNRVHALVGDGLDAPPWLWATAARLHLAAGDPARAGHIAASATWRADLPTRDRLDLLVTGALAARATGDDDRALGDFSRAYALAHETGNHEPLLLVPHDVRRTLLADGRVELDEEVRARLDAAKAVYPRRAELVRLSPRELEVLRHLPHHASTASLARSLSVSVNTVKKQLGSAYAKLGVDNRSAALLAAQQLGLLRERPSSPR